MKRRDIYDIMCFGWNKETNTFHADAWLLDMENTSPFIIKNFETNGFREFKYYRDLPGYWIFKSEDGITCEICIDPHGETLREEYGHIFE